MSDAAEEEKTITLEANDGQKFKISKKAARVSQFCSDALGLDDEDEDDAAAEKTVEVPRVKGDCLGKTVQFMEHYCVNKMEEIELPMSGDSFEEVC